MLCNPEKCVLFVAELDQCFDEIEKNYKLSQMRTTGTIQVSAPQKQTPVVEAMRTELTGTEGVIQRILAIRPNLTKESVERLIDEERAKAAGLLTEEAAAYLVASNLGLDRETPDISGVKWMIKGNVDARDTDAFAYAFVFKYDATAKKATDELRFESAELYNYLKENNNTLTLNGFTYSLNREGSLFGRNKAKTE